MIYVPTLEGFQRCGVKILWPLEGKRICWQQLVKEASKQIASPKALHAQLDPFSIHAGIPTPPFCVRDAAWQPGMWPTFQHHRFCDFFSGSVAHAVDRRFACGKGLCLV